MWEWGGGGAGRRRAGEFFPVAMGVWGRSPCFACGPLAMKCALGIRRCFGYNEGAWS